MPNHRPAQSNITLRREPCVSRTGSAETIVGWAIIRTTEVSMCALRSIIVLLVLAICLPVAPLAGAQERVAAAEEMTVVGEGRAAFTGDVVASEEEAIWDAKRDAVEQAAGVFLRSHQFGHDFTIERDQIEGRSEGFIRRWKRIEGSRRIESIASQNDGIHSPARILHIRIRARIALLPVVKRLADIADVYKDLERPRLRLTILSEKKNNELAGRTRSALSVALVAEGFEIADSGPAEVELRGRLDIVPTVHLGDRASTPYGIGESMAGCRAVLLLEAVSIASEDTLLSIKSDSGGGSFASDIEAAQEAASGAAETLLRDHRSDIIQRLLVRWVHERQEGHTVVIKATGLTIPQQNALREAIRSTRGFHEFTADTSARTALSLRYVTSADTRTIRRWLSNRPAREGGPLVLHNDRGPIIICSASRTTRSVRNYTSTSINLQASGKHASH